VQSAQLAVLPSITPLLSLILVLAAQSPALVMVWRCPTPKMFVWGVIHCSLSAFMLGWHVHEKAILITIIPLTLLAVCHPACPSTQRLFCRLCGAGHFALMPLLLGPDLVLIKTLLWMGYLVLVWTLLGCPPTGLDWLQFSSLALTWLFCEVLHPIISNGAAGRWPFLPLMATSVVCALWLLVCWGEGLLLMRADFRKEVLAASRKKA
jgi:alpha-1,3-glucosyltransferase